ncbi:MAG: helix-turn-helix domain-containing protein [Muribaculaceae bacterium]|nr:helix-turn-helix domain-containing protein [Muribaculaceae bacterium]
MYGQKSVGKRVDELISECDSLSSQFNYVEIEKPARTLLELGLETMDKRAQAYGNLFLGEAYLTNGDGKKSLQFFHESLSMAEDLKDDGLICTIYNCLGIYEATVKVNPYMAQYYFLKSQEIAKKNKDEGLQLVLSINLAELSINRKDSSGLHYALEGYEGGIKNGSIGIRNNGAVQLAILYFLRGDTVESLKYYDIALELCKNDNTQLLGLLYKLRSELYMTSGNYPEAKHYALLSISYLSDNLITELPAAYLQLAKVEYAQGDYAAAEKTLGQAIDAANTSSSKSSIHDIYSLLATVCNAKGDTSRAFIYMQKAKESSDSINHVAQEQLKMQRDIMIEKAEQELAVTSHQLHIIYLRRFIAIMAVSIFVMGILIFILIRNHKRTLSLYDNIVIKNRHLMEAKERLSKLPSNVEELLEGLYEKKEGENIGNVTPSNTVRNSTAKKNENIYQEACRIMTEERLYADPTFTREQLIERLATNHTYFSQAIQQYTGGNYAQWINSWRIKEAIRILSDKTQLDYPLKQLSSDLGFGSIATFYKCFQAETGITPSNFRKSIKHLNNNDLEI